MEQGNRREGDHRDRQQAAYSGQSSTADYAAPSNVPYAEGRDRFQGAAGYPGSTGPGISDQGAAQVTAQSPNGAARLVPRGAIELLPNESVALQIGALYLTSKRVILLTPGVVRTAFIRDVDAVGTVTTRASGWSLFFGLLFVLIGIGAAIVSLGRAQLELSYPALYLVEPLIFTGVAALLAVLLLAMYFFWLKRTLFVSVSGRPLINVSVSEWGARKFDALDAFINTFAQIKDTLPPAERQG